MDTKYCICCKQTKFKFEFNKHSQKKDGLYTYCKTCKALHDKKAYEKNRNNRLIYIKTWAEQNKEKVVLYKQKYKKSNPDTDRAYKSSNKAKINFLNSKRRANIKNRIPCWLTDFDHLKMKCYYQVASMYSRESGIDWHVDHIIPLQGKNVCGLHVPSNLQIIPAIENMRKNNHYEV